MHLVAVGGSDAGISAALRARELDPSTANSGAPVFEGRWPRLGGTLFVEAPEEARSWPPTA